MTHFRKKESFSPLMVWVILAMGCSCSDPSPSPNPGSPTGPNGKSSAKSITRFVFLAADNGALTADITLSIDETHKTIIGSVPSGVDRRTLKPVIEISDHATITPTGIQDFRSTVRYTVKAEDGSEVGYAVDLAQGISSEKRITAFDFLASENTVLGQNFRGVIDEASKTIVVTVSLSVYINYRSSLKPRISVSSLASISPTDARDFTHPVTYTVTAEDGTSVSYRVTVIISEMDALGSILIENGGANPAAWVSKYVQRRPLTEWQGVVLDADGHVSELSLASSSIRTLSWSIGMLPHLTRLELRNNQLTDIPDEIGNLKKLTFLSLSDNNLNTESLPETFGDLSGLTILNLGRNNLRYNAMGLPAKLPLTLGRLTRLTALELSGNLLLSTSFPDEFFQLRNLTVLRLNANALTVVPAGLEQFTALTQLWLQLNSLSALPQFVCNLKNTGADVQFDNGLTCP